MLEYVSDTMVVTPWPSGIQVRDKVTNEDYFLSLSDLRAIYIAIMTHSQRDRITF